MWKRREKLQKFEYLENEKSFLDEYKAFFVVFEGLLFVEKNKKKTADTSFKESWFFMLMKIV